MNLNALSRPSALTSLVQHDPWIGNEYAGSGLDGQRIAVVGYSHWNGEPGGEDDRGFTVDVVQAVMAGSLPRTNFFTCIRKYFGFSSDAEFWPKVIFFNYVPRCVGGPNSRFCEASREQLNKGRSRFFSITGEYTPDKVVFFTSKAWRRGRLPNFSRQLPLNTIGIEQAVLADPCGLYESNGHAFITFGLRHPQGAQSDQMTLAVERIKAFRL